MLLAFARHLPQALHAFAVFFGAGIVLMQAFKYDSDTRARVVATFPYDPGETPVPPSLRSVLYAGVVIAGLGAAALWLTHGLTTW